MAFFPKNFTISRVAGQDGQIDPCAPLEFHPPKGSDELHDALKHAYPHLMTLQERMLQAVIEFHTEEQLGMQRCLSSASSLSDSMWSAMPTLTPDVSPAASFPTLDSSPITPATSSAEGQSWKQEMTAVFSLSGDTVKTRKKRCMTTKEKKEYKQKRLDGACDLCRKRRKKCDHSGYQAAYYRPSSSVSRTSTKPRTKVAAAPPPVVPTTGALTTSSVDSSVESSSMQNDLAFDPIPMLMDFDLDLGLDTDTTLAFFNGPDFDLYSPLMSYPSPSMSASSSQPQSAVSRASLPEVNDMSWVFDGELTQQSWSSSVSPAISHQSSTGVQQAQHQQYTSWQNTSLSESVDSSSNVNHLEVLRPQDENITPSDIATQPHAIHESRHQLLTSGRSQSSSPLQELTDSPGYARSSHSPYAQDLVVHNIPASLQIRPSDAISTGSPSGCVIGIPGPSDRQPNPVSPTGVPYPAAHTFSFGNSDILEDVSVQREHGTFAPVLSGEDTPRMTLGVSRHTGYARRLPRRSSSSAITSTNVFRQPTVTDTTAFTEYQSDRRASQRGVPHPGLQFTADNPGLRTVAQHERVAGPVQLSSAAISPSRSNNESPSDESFIRRNTSSQQCLQTESNMNSHRKDRKLRESSRQTIRTELAVACSDTWSYPATFSATLSPSRPQTPSALSPPSLTLASNNLPMASTVVLPPLNTTPMFHPPSPASASTKRLKSSQKSTTANGTAALGSMTTFILSSTSLMAALIWLSVTLKMAFTFLRSLITLQGHSPTGVLRPSAIVSVLTLSILFPAAKPLFASSAPSKLGSAPKTTVPVPKSAVATPDSIPPPPHGAMTASSRSLLTSGFPRSLPDLRRSLTCSSSSRARVPWPSMISG